MFHDLDALIALILHGDADPGRLRGDPASVAARYVRRCLDNHASAHGARVDLDGFLHRTDRPEAEVRAALPALIALLSLESGSFAGRGDPVVVIDGETLALEAARGRFPTGTDRPHDRADPAPSPSGPNERTPE